MKKTDWKATKPKIKIVWPPREISNRKRGFVVLHFVSSSAIFWFLMKFNLFWQIRMWKAWSVSDFLWELWEMLGDSKWFVMATFVSAGRLHRRSWSTLGMVYQRNSCRKTGSYAAVIMKPELLLARTRSIPTKRTRFKTSVHSSSFANCDRRLHSTSADVNGSLGKEFISPKT